MTEKNIGEVFILFSRYPGLPPNRFISMIGLMAMMKESKSYPKKSTPNVGDIALKDRKIKHV